MDPSGLDAIVKVEGTKVSIKIPITYNGVGSKEDIARMNAGIESNWSGQFGKYNVTTEVIEGKMNRIKLVPSPFRSRVNHVGGNKGTWCKDDSGWTAAHEAGHLMGLEDQYDVNGKPLASWVGHIMAETNGIVKQDEIQMIIDYSKEQKKNQRERDRR